jgi:hypothetical protein
MTTRPTFTSIAACSLLLFIPSALFAQRGGAPVPPPSEALSPRPAAMAGLLTVAQRDALDALAASTSDLAGAANAARQALVAASMASPVNAGDLRLRANQLGQAEMALANARADRFAQFQAGPNQLAPDALQPGIARLGTAGGGRGGLMAPRMADDADGFVSIFDGRTLNGWEGDTTFWRAEDGKIVGESTPEKVVSHNTFLIWRGGTLRDFELKTEFRINGTNSGIQYRSHVVPEAGPHVLSGYQADMDIGNNYTGGLGEERGRRNVMVPRGQMIRLTENDTYKFMGTLGDPAEIGGSFVPNGWNTYHIIARGPVLIHILNGRVSAIMIDEDEGARAMEGVLGFQMHTGQPFKVEYRNILYREL